MTEETRTTLVEASRPVRWAAAAALGVLALFLLVKTFDAMDRFGEGENPMVNSITVSGTGTSSATPDMATITFAVQESAADVKSAQDAATKRVNDAIAAMKDLGIDGDDVKTMDYSVSPQYASAAIAPCYPGTLCQPATTKVNGYQVMQTVQVTIHDVAKAGDAVTKLGTLGVQNISGPNFMVDDDNGVMNEARAKAIANANDKAKQLAKELGVSLGDVMSYYDQQNEPMPYATASFGRDGAPEMDAAIAPQLPTGTDERTVNVQVTYEIH